MKAKNLLLIGLLIIECEMDEKNIYYLGKVTQKKRTLDQAPIQNKRGRPPNDSLVNRNYPKSQSSSMRTEEASAFDRGLEAEKILGATDATVTKENFSL
jgi:hypothetical protein